MNVKTFYVYQLSDDDNVPFYIGKGMKTESYDRISFHTRYWHHNKNRKLVNKIKKLGQKFCVTILLNSKNEQKCLDYEVELIQKIGLPRLCNLTLGGEGISGWKHSKSTKKKMSISANQPHRIKTAISNFVVASQKNKGKRKLSKHHNKIVNLYKTKSICQICKILNVDFNQLRRYLKEIGLYIKNKNRPKISDETRKKLSDSHKGILGKTVLQYDMNDNFIQEFSSVTDASQALNKPGRHGDISSCCLNKPSRHTAFGYKWKYKQ